MGSPDWGKIKREYIRGGTSYRKLAERHGVPMSHLRSRAKNENWVGLREQARNRTDTKTVEKISDMESETDARVYNAAMLLMSCLEQSVKALAEDGGLDPDAMRGYSVSLRNIQQVLSSRPTQRDIEEQQARIDKLRKEAKLEDKSGMSLTVSIEGDMDAYAD